MGDHDDGLVAALLSNQLGDLAAGSTIEMIKRLVEDDQLGIRTKSLGEQGFLPLATAAGVPGFTQLLLAKQADRGCASGVSKAVEGNDLAKA